MTESRTILGIDPGTNLLGFGIVRVDAKGRPGFVDMGVLDLRKEKDAYAKLRRIYEKVGALCDLHHPDDLAIESPFYGHNAQVILKLGRAQGAAMMAALSRDIPVFEYAPRKAKMAICGNGAGHCDVPFLPAHQPADQRESGDQLGEIPGSQSGSDKKIAVCLNFPRARVSKESL